MRVIGAGFGRTGTNSLKLALERLLGAPCYHMFELIARPDDVAVWTAAADGEDVDWPTFLAGWGAAVDWPAVSFHAELAEAFPDAIVVLSVRDPDAWWTSADRTIFPMLRSVPHRGTGEPTVGDVARRLVLRDVGSVDDPDVARRAFVDHLERVRATVDPARLVEWSTSDGWGPLCAALGVPVPDEPFPRTNDGADLVGRVAAAVEGRVERRA
jgi:hypothetical protein